MQRYSFLDDKGYWDGVVENDISKDRSILQTILTIARIFHPISPGAFLFELANL